MADTTRALGRLRRPGAWQAGSRWRVLVAGYAALALLAVATSAPGWYVGDNRFEQYWSPGRVLARLPHLWDAGRGLGRPRGELALVPAAVLAPLRGLGVPPAVAERLWHALLLTVAAAGVAYLVRSLRPGPGPAHAVAGLVYAFNPYSAVFLLPSGLYLNYAIAPWLVAAFLAGTRRNAPWRWAAAFALLVLASGGTDPPGLVFAVALLAPTAAYVAWVERSASWTRILAWTGRAALLCALVLPATLAQIAFGRGALLSRLLGTESLEVVSRTSSWAESWRGLGFWVSYFPTGAGLLRPDLEPYLTSAGVILATFALPAAALVALGWVRWRPRVLLGGLALTGLVLMVGGYPPEEASPFGSLLLGAADSVSVLGALRTTYKAGSGLALGTAALIGVGAVAAARRLAPRRALRAGTAAAAVVVLGVASFPFWTGRLYSATNRMREVPAYWRSALSWLDDRSGSGRVLVVPGTGVTRYRWGSPGDDLFDALLARANVVDTGLPLSTPEAESVVRAVDDRIQSGRYRAGTLAPVARRLGIRWVVIRNDLDWQELDRARPSDLRSLREDPDLEAVAAFGRPGQSVVAAGDESLAARSEARLPPVEVLALRDPEPVVRAAPVGGGHLISGDGNGWLIAAAGGRLDDAATVRHSAGEAHRELTGPLAAGADVMVTDTNRRRVDVVTGTGLISSHTLAAGEDLDRPAGALFDRPGSQSVASFEDALRIASDSTGEEISGFEPWYRPANAFDGDPETWWLTGALADPVGRSVEVTLREPTVLGGLEVTAAGPEGAGRRVVAASVVLPDGSAVPLDLSDGRARARAPDRPVESFRVRIDAVEGPGQRPVGLADVRVSSLDLAEVIQVPDDLFRAASADPALEARLEAAPVSYMFEPAPGDGPVAVEPTLRRRFRTMGRRSYELRGTADGFSARLTTSTVARRAEKPSGELSGGCRDDLVRVDGRPAPVRLVTTPEDPERLAYEGCTPLELDEGWHRLDVGRALGAQTATLSTGVRPAAGEVAPPTSPETRVLERGPSSLGLAVTAPPVGAVLVSGFAYDPGWEATVDGRDLGPPASLDAQAAWSVPAGESVVEVRYGPQRVYDAALAVTLGGVGLCGWILCRRRRE